MIRKTWNTDKWLLTAQPEHARLAAIIAASWNFPGPKPHEQLFKAVITHDDGWKEAEQAPLIKPNGDPCSFHEMPVPASLEIFDRSIAERTEANQPYGAMLVTGHFLHLVESADLARVSIKDAVASGQFIARQRRHLANLREQVKALENGEELLTRYDEDLRFLQVCDYLSLLLCTDFYGEETIENVPYLHGGNRLTVRRKGNGLALTLSPLPFKKNLRDHLTSWVVPYIPYDSSDELAAAMEEVKTVTNEVHFGADNS